MKSLESTSQPIQAKHLQVRDRILEQISLRVIKKGQCIPSEPSLCKQLGVSRDTVRRAIKGLVSDGVLETRLGYGHVVLGARTSTAIGLLWNFPIFSPKAAPSHLLLFRACREQIKQRNCRLRMYLPPSGEEHGPLIDYEKLERDISRQRFVGLLGAFWPDSPSQGEEVVAKNDRVIEMLAKAKIPYVALRSLDQPGCVGTDYRALGYMATRHLLDQGLKRVALLVPSKFNTLIIDGYHEAHRDAGMQAASGRCIPIGEAGDRSGYEGFKKLWAQPNRPEAVVIPDDITARGAMTAALELGASIPQDIRFACHAVKDSHIFYPRPILRMEMNPTDRVSIALNMLLKSIDDPKSELGAKRMQPTLVDETLGE